MNIKNISILAHVDAGKTSLTEAILNTSGIKNTFGSVDEGTTLTDTNALEIEKGISIYTSTTSTIYKDTKINIIDTPGHMDFINEVEQALLATDLAILVIAANDHTLKPQTKEVYQKLCELQIPTIIFINKIDIESSNIASNIKRIKTMTKHKAFELNDSEALVEHLALTNDTYLEKVLNNTNTEEDDKNILFKSINNLNIFPILKGSAVRRWGVEELLDLIVSIPNHLPDNNKLSAIVYKKQFVKNRLDTYIRIFSGSLSVLDSLTVNNKTFKITNLKYLNNGNIENTNTVKAGDIAIISDTLNFDIATWIGDPIPNKKLPTWTNGQYAVSLNYEAGKRIKVLEALHRIKMVNPFVTYTIDEITQDINLILIGEVQKDVIAHTLKSEYHLNVTLGPVTIVNKITPQKAITDTVIMNTIENSHWATMTFEMKPLPLGSGVQYKTLINTGYLRQSFQNAIIESVDHIRDTPYNGQYLTDYQLTLTHAEFASPVSTPSDFRHSTLILFNKIMEQTPFTTLEPLGLFKLSVPESSLQKAYQDLSLKEAQIMSTNFEHNLYIIEGLMKLKDSLNYEAQVYHYTSGEGSFSIEFDSYLPQK